jgi:hypothetical protein
LRYPGQIDLSDLQPAKPLSAADPAHGNFWVYRRFFFNRRASSILSRSLSGSISRTTPRPGITRAVDFDNHTPPAPLCALMAQPVPFGRMTESYERIEGLRVPSGWTLSTSHDFIARNPVADFELMFELDSALLSGTKWEHQ